MPTLHRAVGCSACSKTGYRGRLALHEVMTVTEEIERLTVTRASAFEIGRSRRSRACGRSASTAWTRPGRRHLARGDPPRRGLTPTGRFGRAPGFLKTGRMPADADLRRERSRCSRTTSHEGTCTWRHRATTVRPFRRCCRTESAPPVGLSPLDPGWTPDGGHGDLAVRAAGHARATAGARSPSLAPAPWRRHRRTRGRRSRRSAAPPLLPRTRRLPTVSPSAAADGASPAPEPPAAAAVNSQVELDTSYARAALEEDSGHRSRPALRAARRRARTAARPTFTCRPAPARRCG